MDAPREILLIEDQLDDRDLFRMAVEASGIDAEVTVASSAAETVRHLNACRDGSRRLPSLVVLDLGLFDVQGTALLQLIRQAYGPHVLPVVVLTGSHRTSDRIECESWGILAYFTKPQTYKQLIALVELMMDMMEGVSELSAVSLTGSASPAPLRVPFVSLERLLTDPGPSKAK